MAVDLPPGWMRQIIDASHSRPVAAQRLSRCVGHFFDNKTRQNVSIDLGRVNLTVPNVFRAVPLEDEPKNILSWEFSSLEEGTAQNMESIPFFTDVGFSVKYPTKTVGQKSVRVLCNTRTNSHGWELSDKKHPRTNSDGSEKSC